MQKEQIAVHTVPSKEGNQLLQTPASTLPTTALVPVSKHQTPPIVESTIIIQEPPLPDEEAEPISAMPVQRRWRVPVLLLALSSIGLLSIGLYFLLPLLFSTATVTITPMEKRLTTSATIHIAAQTNQPAANQIPGRLLPSLTLSQAQTVKTTGIGHQPATEAQGYITLYNGLLASQTIPAGTVLTGADGVQVITDQMAVLPAATPPYEGQVTISAHATVPGSRGNIAAYDMNTAVSSTILAKNLQPFYGGRDARTYPVVAQADIDSAISHLKPSLAQSMQGAFNSQLTTGEALIQPTCVLKTVPDHGVGEEAAQVQVSLSETCQAAAYQQANLQQIVTRLVSQEAVQRYGRGYTLMGDMNLSLANTALTSTSQQIATLTVHATSQWVYQVGQSQQQQISQHIAGKSKQDALNMLTHLAGIQAVSVNLVGGISDLLPQDAGRIQVVVIYRFV